MFIPKNKRTAALVSKAVKREHCGTLTNAEKIQVADQADDSQKRVELLYDYTKFHISAYLTVTGSYLTSAFATNNGNPVLSLNLYFLLPAVLFTMVAGLAGGIICIRHNY